MTDHYDVIIIGSGAGGGTLAHRLAPSGKRILILERGDYLPREPRELGSPTAVFVKQPLPCRRSTWYDADGKPFQPAGALLRRRRHEALRRGAVPPARAGLRRAAPRRRHLARLADLLRRPRAVLHARPSGSTRCTATRGEDPTEPPASAPYPFPAVSHEPRIQQLVRRPRARRATTRSTLRAGSCSTRPTARRARCIRCTTLRRLSRASCTPSPTPRSSPYDPSLEQPNVTLLANAEVLRLETDATGTAVTGGGRRRRGDTEEIYSGDIVVVSAGAVELRQAAARVGQRPHPNGLANGSDQVGRNYMFHNSKAVGRALEGAEPTAVPEDARRSTTSTSARRTTTTRSATSRWSASRTPRR